MDELVEELKSLLIDTLDLEEIKPEDIVTDAPLFNEGLGLDSIDALELAIALEQSFGVRLEEDSDENVKIFASVRSLDEFVSQNRTQ